MTTSNLKFAIALVLLGLVVAQDSLVINSIPDQIIVNKDIPYEIDMSDYMYTKNSTTLAVYSIQGQNISTRTTLSQAVLPNGTNFTDINIPQNEDGSSNTDFFAVFLDQNNTLYWAPFSQETVPDNFTENNFTIPEELRDNCYTAIPIAKDTIVADCRKTVNVSENDTQTNDYLVYVTIGDNGASIAYNQSSQAKVDYSPDNGRVLKYAVVNGVAQYVYRYAPQTYHFVEIFNVSATEGGEDAIDFYDAGGKIYDLSVIYGKVVIGVFDTSSMVKVVDPDSNNQYKNASVQEFDPHFDILALHSFYQYTDNGVSLMLAVFGHHGDQSRLVVYDLIKSQKQSTLFIYNSIGNIMEPVSDIGSYRIIISQNFYSIIKRNGPTAIFYRLSNGAYTQILQSDDVNQEIYGDLTFDRQFVWADGNLTLYQLERPVVNTSTITGNTLTIGLNDFTQEISFTTAEQPPYGLIFQSEKYIERYPLATGSQSLQSIMSDLSNISVTENGSTQHFDSLMIRFSNPGIINVATSQNNIYRFQIAPNSAPDSLVIHAFTVTESQLIVETITPKNLQLSNSYILPDLFNGNIVQNNDGFTGISPETMAISVGAGPQYIAFVGTNSDKEQNLYLYTMDLKTNQKFDFSCDKVETSQSPSTPFLFCLQKANNQIVLLQGDDITKMNQYNLTGDSIGMSADFNVSEFKISPAYPSVLFTKTNDKLIMVDVGMAPDRFFFLNEVQVGDQCTVDSFENDIFYTISGRKLVVICYGKDNSTALFYDVTNIKNPFLITKQDTKFTVADGESLTIISSGSEIFGIQEKGALHFYNSELPDPMTAIETITVDEDTYGDLYQFVDASPDYDLIIYKSDEDDYDATQLFRKPKIFFDINSTTVNSTSDYIFQTTLSIKDETVKDYQASIIFYLYVTQNYQMVAASDSFSEFNLNDALPGHGDIYYNISLNKVFTGPSSGEFTINCSNSNDTDLFSFATPTSIDKLQFDLIANAVLFTGAFGDDGLYVIAETASLLEIGQLSDDGEFKNTQMIPDTTPETLLDKVVSIGDYQEYVLIINVPSPMVTMINAGNGSTDKLTLPSDVTRVHDAFFDSSSKTLIVLVSVTNMLYLYHYDHSDVLKATLSSTFYVGQDNQKHAIDRDTGSSSNGVLFISGFQDGFRVVTLEYNYLENVLAVANIEDIKISSSPAFFHDPIDNSFDWINIGVYNCTYSQSDSSLENCNLVITPRFGSSYLVTYKPGFGIIKALQKYYPYSNTLFLNDLVVKKDMFYVLGEISDGSRIVVSYKIDLTQSADDFQYSTGSFKQDNSSVLSKIGDDDRYTYTYRLGSSGGKCEKREVLYSQNQNFTIRTNFTNATKAKSDYIYIYGYDPLRSDGSYPSLNISIPVKLIEEGGKPTKHTFLTIVAIIVFSFVVLAALYYFYKVYQRRKQGLSGDDDNATSFVSLKVFADNNN